jgi:hypothetical protein
MRRLLGLILAVVPALPLSAADIGFIGLDNAVSFSAEPSASISRTRWQRNQAVL